MVSVFLQSYLADSAIFAEYVVHLFCSYFEWQVSHIKDPVAECKRSEREKKARETCGGVPVDLRRESFVAEATTLLSSDSCRTRRRAAANRGGRHREAVEEGL